MNIGESNRYPYLRQTSTCVVCCTEIITAWQPPKPPPVQPRFCGDCKKQGYRYVRYQGDDGLLRYCTLTNELARHESDAFKARYEIIEGAPW